MQRSIHPQSPSLTHISSAKVHYRSGISMQPHFHDEACLVLILSGSVEHTEGCRSTVLQSRQMLYLPPAERHADTFGSSGVHCVVIKIDPAWVQRRVGADFFCLTPKVAADGHLYALGTTIHREIRNPDDLSAMIVEGALLELMGRWKRECRIRAQQVPAWLARVKMILADSFRDSVSMQDLSRIAGVHPAHVAREFRRAYGMTTGAYVRKLRVDFVAQQLNDPQKAKRSRLADLAFEAGFSSHAHMAFLFHQIMGVTPSEYRREHAATSSR